MAALVVLLYLGFMRLATAYETTDSYPECCPEIKTVADVDWDKYQGEWHLAYKTADQVYSCVNTIVKKEGDVITWNSELTIADGERIQVTKSVTLKTSISPKAKGTYMEEQKCESRECGKGIFPDHIHVFVVAPDYNTSVINYSCYCVDKKPKESAWVLYRKDKTPDSVEQMEKVLQDQGLHIKLLSARSNCG